MINFNTEGILQQKLRVSVLSGVSYWHIQHFEVLGFLGQCQYILSDQRALLVMRYYCLRISCLWRNKMKIASAFWLVVQKKGAQTRTVIWNLTNHSVKFNSNCCKPLLFQSCHLSNGLTCLIWESSLFSNLGDWGLRCCSRGFRCKRSNGLPVSSTGASCNLLWRRQKATVGSEQNW